MVGLLQARTGRGPALRWRRIFRSAVIGKVFEAIVPVGVPHTARIIVHLDPRWACRPGGCAAAVLFETASAPVLLEQGGGGRDAFARGLGPSSRSVYHLVENQRGCASDLQAWRAACGFAWPVTLLHLPALRLGVDSLTSRNFDASSSIRWSTSLVADTSLALLAV